MAVSINTEEIIHKFTNHVKTLKRHIYIKRIQNTTFNSLKANLHDNEVIIQVDYSENYANKDQHQIQSAYFGQQCFSIFTACCYLQIDEVLVNENVTVTSEESDHSRIAALSCWLRVLSFVQEKYSCLLESLVLHIWSDGCAGQFRSRFVFSLLSQFAIGHTLFWYYNERHHGKGPMDGIGGTIKHRVFRDVKSEKVNIRNAEHSFISFASYADTILKGIKSLYMSLEVLEVLIEPENVGNALKIPGTLEIHKIGRSFNSDGVCKLNFYHTAVDESPFHVQWYRKNGDPEVHPELPLSFDPSMTCVKCRLHTRKLKSGSNVTSVISGFTKNVFIYEIFIHSLIF